MTKPRRPHVASPDEVKITRQGDTAMIEYADPKVATTNLKRGLHPRFPRHPAQVRF